MKPVNLTAQVPTQGTLFTLTVTLLSILCAALLSACGGGSRDSPVPPARAAGSEAAADVSSVQLEGCVVDEFYIPRTGTTVAVQSGDGRLIGHATSAQDGLFRLRVPARQTVSITVERTGGEALVVLTGRADLVAGACLRDPRT